MKYLFPAALFAVAVPLAAQEAPRDLSLDEALRIAEASNPGYRSAQSDVRAASARERQALGTLLPSLNSSLGLSGQISSTRVGQDDFGRPLPSETVVESTNTLTGHGLSASIPLFERGRLGELKAAGADEAGAVAGVRVERGRVRADVVRRYNEAVRAERVIRLEEQLLASAREGLDATQRLFRIAARSMSEVLGAEVEVARAEQAVEQARADARKAKLVLGEVMGTMEVEESRLTTEPVAVFDPGFLRADSLVALALQRHPRVSQAGAGITAAEHRARAARGDRWPTISASAGYNRSVRGQDYDAVQSFVNPFDPFDRAFSFGLNVSLPVFDQFRTTAAVAQADATRTRAQETLRATRLAVEREVREATIDLKNAFRAAQNSERTAKLSRDRLELAREQYRLGATGFTELQQVIDRAAEAEREALRARFVFANAVATLEERVGAPVRP